MQRNTLQGEAQGKLRKEQSKLQDMLT